jgi:chromosome segregation ATPase
MASDGVKEELGISPVALDALERDFVEVMKELSAEDNLERFRLEYEKLHRALKKSHDSEKRLIKKCQELHQEITQNAAKVQSALRLSQDDANSLDTLRKEIEKAWKMVDAAHEKESRAKETIQMLKKEVNRLTTLVEHGAGLTLGQETNLQDRIDQKRELTKERDALSQKVVQQTHELRELIDSVKKMDAELTHKTADLTQRADAYQKLSREHEDELRKREMAEAKVQDLHKAIEKRSRDLEVLKTNVKRKGDDHDKLEKALKEERDKVHELTVRKEKLGRELEAKKEEVTSAEEKTEQQNKVEPRLQAQLEQKKTQLDKERSRHKKLQLTVRQQDQELERLKRKRDDVASQTGTYQKRIAELMKQLEDEKRTVEGAEREVKDEVRNKNLSVTKAVREETTRNALKASEGIEAGKNRSLQQELESHRSEVRELKKKIEELQEQQRKYEEAATKATKSYHPKLEEVKIAKRRIAERTTDLSDAEKRLKNQNAMYEQVLSDRNLYSKNHNEAKEEIEEMDKRFKVMEQQIKQLKDELKKRELELCEAHAKHDTVVRDHKAAEESSEKLEGSLKDARSRAAELADEIKQLTQIIADCDTEKAKQQMKFNSVTNERNILATQLIRRNEELSLLYEKIRIQQSTLLKGESQYRERLVDIGMLRKKVHILRTQLRTSLARIRYVEEMRRQVTTLQRALIRERTKVKALFEELQNPMNVHRWRKLEGSDPAEYENILKLHTLQKRLISKIEESRQKDLVIREKEKEYADLKAVLARQPGPEIAEQLTVYHENIIKRSEQLRRMSDELDGGRKDTAELKQEIERLQAELQDVKKKFFTLKSKNTLMLRERTLANTNLANRTDAGDAEFVVHHPVAQPRFAGGGFCLSTN